MIRHAILMVALTAGWQAAPPRTATTPLLEAVARAFQLLDARKPDEARTQFTRLQAEAVTAGDRSASAEAARGLARIAASEGRTADATALLMRAREEADAGGSDFFAGRASLDLGTLAWRNGNGPDTRTHYEAAVARFERAGALVEYGRALRSLTFASGVSNDEEKQLLEKAVQAGRAANSRSVEGLALHSWGDALFRQGDYAVATATITAAVGLLEAEGNRAALARALTSLGRTRRAHGHPEQALED